MTHGLSWQLVIELLVLGCFTGFLAGLLGVGGGMLMVPFMTLLLSAKNMPTQYVVKMAIATSLATICFTSIASMRAHHQRGAVIWDIVKLLAPGIVLGGLVGAQVAKALQAQVLALLFAAFVSFSAVQMLIDKKPKATRQLPGLKGIPLLYVTAENSNRLQGPAVVEAAKQSGAVAEHLYLKDRGLRGNGHFAMFENNRKQVFEVFRSWAESTVKA